MPCRSRPQTGSMAPYFPSVLRKPWGVHIIPGKLHLLGSCRPGPIIHMSFHRRNTPACSMEIRIATVCKCGGGDGFFRRACFFFIHRLPPILDYFTLYPSNRRASVYATTNNNPTMVNSRAQNTNSAIIPPNSSTALSMRASTITCVMAHPTTRTTTNWSTLHSLILLFFSPTVVLPIALTLLGRPAAGGTSHW
jgi:hypothetical protein